MKTDEHIESQAIEYFIDENLSVDEQDILMSVLEQDDELSSIFDKIIMRAAENTSEGEVEGPGTGTSDEVAARLSDGEFVFTAEAVEVLGVDNLQALMEEAEKEGDLSKVDVDEIFFEEEVLEEGTDTPVTIKESARDKLDSMDKRSQMLRGLKTEIA